MEVLEDAPESREAASFPDFTHEDFPERTEDEGYFGISADSGDGFASESPSRGGSSVNGDFDVLNELQTWSGPASEKNF